MDESKAAREPKVRIIEKALTNLDNSIRHLEDFVQSLDSNQIATAVKGKEESAKAEFQLWDSLSELIAGYNDRICKIEAFLKEKLR